ncbi:hypothetical protein DNI29_04320 [Hymenobacter sediminis]|uniref:hypothetical protein n=1 Tax=Hymenobacter sediminis TaxID=2218621 RepID=UPI000DA680B7|nr:hypothetical protein [Hymenobacter sediminis]RPD50028.1 hypothetical protein DNI29_04320 [Hymenobacter sediminis]
MKYNPTINCAAFSTADLTKRLSHLEDMAAGLTRPDMSPNLHIERERIEQALKQRELKARTYPSQMATPQDPTKPRITARVGANTRGGSAASLSYGFTK